MSDSRPIVAPPTRARKSPAERGPTSERLMRELQLDIDEGQIIHEERVIAILTLRALERVATALEAK